MPVCAAVLETLSEEKGKKRIHEVANGIYHLSEKERIDAAGQVPLLKQKRQAYLRTSL